MKELQSWNCPLAPSVCMLNYSYTVQVLWGMVNHFRLDQERYKSESDHTFVVADFYLYLLHALLRKPLHWVVSGQEIQIPKAKSLLE